MDAVVQKREAREYHEGVQMRCDWKRVWTCPWVDISKYPISPISEIRTDRPSFVEDDVWIFPPEWNPPNRRAPSERRIDFSKAVPAGCNESEAELLKRRVKRLALLDGFQTIQINGRSSNPPTPVTWSRRTAYIINAARYSVEFLRPERVVSSCPDGYAIFAGLTPDAFAKLRAENRSLSACVSRLNGLFAGGLMDDWPATDVSPGERRKRQNSKADQPFTDDAFTEIVRSALWLSSIQSDVLKAYLELKGIDVTPDGGLRSNDVIVYRRESVRAWSSSALLSGTPFPYSIKLAGPQNKTTSYVMWPLDTVRGLRDLVWCCQIANAVLILASTGMRVGELAALTIEALTIEMGRMYIRCPSFKDTDAPEGQLRMWPLPRITSRAVEGQMAIATALGSSESLWVTFIGEKCISGMPELSAALVNFGQRLSKLDDVSLSELDGKLTPHRFRYAVARLVALSLSNASQVLFDVLGHDDEEVTLGYSHRDPEFLQDINKIRQEVKAVRVKEAFDHAEENGGGAAGLINRIKVEMLARSGKKELETDDLVEAAEILGEAELVRPGVLCTAQPLERGACSSSFGLRDFASCTSSCIHRLELAAKRQDRMRVVEQILSQIDASDGGTRVFLQGQLLANLDAFPRLIDEYASDPRLSAGLRDCDKPTWDALEEDVRLRLAPILEGLR